MKFTTISKFQNTSQMLIIPSLLMHYKTLSCWFESPKESSSQTYATSIRLLPLENGPQFANVGVFNRDGKSLA